MLRLPAESSLPKPGAHGERKHHGARSARPQSEEHRLRNSPQRHDGGDGAFGVGQVVLAFDTVYAEGQRRYVESLSAYARQFLERIEKPDVDVIDGIAPAVAIRQKNTTRNPRSTVATATEIYDYLRLLYARVGRTYCLNCGQEVKKDTVDEVAQRILALGEGARVQAFFPVRRRPSLPSRKNRRAAASPRRRQSSRRKIRG